MRRPLMIANWKMNKTAAEAAAFAREFLPLAGRGGGVETVVAPPFTALPELARVLAGSNVSLAAQNMHWEMEGAFTGEVSAAMLRDLGCRFVILGHSERRQLFGEGDGEVGRKVGTALREGLIPILCVGETLGERDYGKTFEVIERQLRGGIEGALVEGGDDLVVAYEPVWAIGTGKTAGPEAAQEVHLHLRGLLSALLGEVAGMVRILYGGSVKPDNVKGLMAQPDIDGALIGGASLKAEGFAAMVRSVQQ
jgi:triosephosphate isomerase